ncbi:hypothetical protein V3M66_00200 [Trueperella pyogenes]|uniref:hypothetical protein n=1 Tax=Trueperella pyogenes TaxID=1661 RepID=UPI00345D856E
MATFQLTLPMGISRKHAAHLIVATTDQPAKYMRTPSMAYQVGSYRLTRHSELLTPAGISDPVWTALLEAGIKVEQTGFDPEAVRWVAITVPLPGWGEREKHNLVAMLEAYGPLIGRALRLGIDGDVQFTTNKDGQCVAEFVWFDQPVPDADFEAATALVHRLVDKAATARTARAAPPQADNDRYAMRTWLTRLGFNGPEHAATRHALTHRLEGNGAWRNPATNKQRQEVCDGVSAEVA